MVITSQQHREILLSTCEHLSFISGFRHVDIISKIETRILTTYPNPLSRGNELDTLQCEKPVALFPPLMPPKHSATTDFSILLLSRPPIAHFLIRIGFHCADLTCLVRRLNGESSFTSPHHHVYHYSICAYLVFAVVVVFFHAMNARR